jgi:phospholipid/cholesterol/gamma-HCH transport system permease protein
MPFPLIRMQNLTSPPLLTATPSGDVLELRPGGSWTAANVTTLEALSDGVTAQLDRSKTVKVDMAEVRELDTLGAWLLEKISRRATRAGRRTEVVGIADNYAGLIEEVRQVNRHNPAPVRRLNPVVAMLNDVGRAAIGGTEDVSVFLQMLGSLFLALVGVLRRPRSLRLTSLIYQLYRVGFQAIPIMVLITFLIGAIIAQQGFFHFRKFGAESYVVDMVGILVLRELGVLIVAIMVAGRSGSAYTAELGSMKMREEIDALSTMGLDPVEVLILPRIIALVIALPILSFIGSMAALYGGGLVAQLYGDMGPAIFIARLHDAVSVTSFKVGIIKAPFMALAIGIVACSEGLRVKGSAESLGKQTTTSVVKSIFLVIVLDGLFAVFFASIGM